MNQQPQTTPTDWTKTETFIDDSNRPYSLFGLRGTNSRQFVHWWYGEASDEPRAYRLTPFEWVLIYGFIGLCVVAGVFPPLAAVLVTGIGLFLILYVLRAWLSPGLRERWAEEERKRTELTRNTQSLTMVLWLGRGLRLGTNQQPLKLIRDRHSTVTSTDRLPHDRYIYVTLNGLTQEEK